MKRLVIHLGLLPGESCGDWDSNLASVTDSDGDRIGYVEKNDGATVTVMVLEDQLRGARMTEPTQLNMLAEIPPVFMCEIDESAGQREDHENTQLTELPGDTFEEIFQR